MPQLYGEYNMLIVLLSYFIALVASYSALMLTGNIARAKGRSKTVWLIASSCVMGCGIWSMHFVGMLAYHPGIPISYDIPTTLFSVVAAIAASYIAFRVTAGEPSRLRLVLGGFVMGCGIVTMHYTGMAAMRMDARMSYNDGLVALSVLIALVASYAALYLFRKFRMYVGFSVWKLASAAVMGLAICGMHYTGMAACRFDMSSAELHGAHTAADPYWILIAGVALATFFILSVSWAAIYFDRHVLERMAYTDPLTGLPNRHYLLQYFENVFGVTSGGFLLFIDLDRFKAINDTLGHDIGDLLIGEAAERLKAALQDGETAFRLGGDEFLVASAGGDGRRAGELAKTLLESLKRAYHLEGNELYITASIGVSLSPDHGSDRNELLKAADTAMYNAKLSGKNQYRLFDEEMDRKLMRKLELEKDMRKALARNEFHIVYQPKWDSQSERLVGTEALLRWNHPSLGLVSPAEFVPIAEETGMIVPITRWILQEVCRQNVAWKADGLHVVPIAVNLSVRVFESESLQAMIAEALESSGMEPRWLELEITETIAMHDFESTTRQLRQLREIGVRVSMDDFGTGYSSLGSLDELPVDTLKIDQTFIQQSELPSKRAIISTIISMAAALNLEVVAEGVETQEQMHFLQSRGCRVMQGYYYGKPMEAGDIRSWLKSGNDGE